MNIELTPEQAEAFGRGESITLTPKPKQWKPTVSLDWVDRAHISTYTLLLKYVKEFGGDWEADWSDSSQGNYYVYCNGRNSPNKWDSYYSDGNERYSGTVYMSRDCAKGLVAKLNSGEVTL